jgi:hypothetical protein
MENKIVRSVKSALPISLWLTLLQFGIRAASAPTAPVEMISNFDLRHGEWRVSLDSTHATALGINKPPPWLQKTCLIKAYSGHFSRVASSKCERAAEEYRLWL